MELAREALALLPERDSDGRALAFRTLGNAYAKRGNVPESAASYQRAIEMYHHPDMRFDEAQTYIDRGDLHLEAGDPGSARECWHRALATHAEGRHPQADQVLDRLVRLDSGVPAG
ncbi:MAG TPA: tetratricopeptide repeat protein [Actinophytocola sp.]|uniref:tetratricopeptide repeat protein n=1 Tax=Actinophytocola sp. TaxID=1872138 RepID=UPI002DDD13C9|nr:tetratricopeptide repeat protein [Actinophytocola sp.]HEV2780703.1 tetratricopeptide repeat protein [Actinophytocola sp.]